MHNVKLYELPYPDPTYEFSTLHPFLSKFVGLGTDEEAAATRDLIAALDARDRGAMQLAAIQVIGAQDFDLRQHRAFGITRRRDDTLDIRPIPAESLMWISSSWPNGEGPAWSPWDIPALASPHAVAEAADRLAAMSEPPLATDAAMQAVRDDLLMVIAGQCHDFGHRPRPGERYHVSVCPTGVWTELVPDDA